MGEVITDKDKEYEKMEREAAPGPDQAMSGTHPILAIMGVHEKVLRVMVGTRSHEQFRNMRLAGLRLRRIRIDGIQHQHRAGLEILTQTGVVGERRIRTERVIAIVVAHLRLSGRNHDTLARERLAQRLQIMASIGWVRVPV